MKANLFHELKGKHIYFKTLGESDVQEIHHFASDADVSRFIGWRLMQSLDETEAYIGELIKRETAGTHLYASIVLKATDKIIGTAMMFNFDKEANHGEIGYVFHKDYWGQGYGTEAVTLMKDFAFQSLKLNKIHARVVDANIGSYRVLEKNGFDLEGRFKDYYFIEGNYYDGLFFGKLT
ncbi:GNAT family N-acetyltransferase [Anaerobacillus isosaccharinicus]|uniref:GNAT family N-acetyltransferase n=1 Tax=Anaerobacillus isosaccharinicus TaxID=1532552 RepID=A0A1S2MEY3_9BACI|nr:GNAT family protein [Anaerobacillus isosaccharinicus]MBA5586469.1 GNAT family N-acetyltransferase [Anaerobacillus isosaccharinicus]QOY35288.1 GNAT family N-acetyltransferase [Anaerobacillus isosaccharinicus]